MCFNFFPLYTFIQGAFKCGGWFAISLTSRIACLLSSHPIFADTVAMFRGGAELGMGVLRFPEHSNILGRDIECCFEQTRKTAFAAPENPRSSEIYLHFGNTEWFLALECVVTFELILTTLWLWEGVIANRHWYFLNLIAENSTMHVLYC